MKQALKQNDIGTIGAGFLGGTLLRFWREVKGWHPRVYDKNGMGSVEDINKARYVFVCVNTPYIEYSFARYWQKMFFAKTKKNLLGRSREQFISLLPELMFFFNFQFVDSAIKILQGEKIVVIHSTLIPFGTEYFKRKYPQHTFLFNPEFLRAATAYDDFLKSDRHIVGFTDEKSKARVDDIFSLLPEGAEKITMPSFAAEAVKLFSNTFLAQRVTMANVVYDLFHHLGHGHEYAFVQSGIGADKRIGSWGFDVFFESFRGWSGTCFPKDTRIIRDYYRVLGISDNPISGFIRHNDMLMEKQGLRYDFGYPKTASRKKTI